MKLPTEKNVPPSKLTDYSWLLYGEKGLGKTSISAEFPDVEAHYMLQVNRWDVKTLIIPQKGEEPLTWPRVKGYNELLLKKFKTPGRVIIDDLDGCARLCQQYHAALNRVVTLNGLKDNGKAWDTMKSDWENTWLCLLWSGWRITTTSHARVRPKVVRGIARDDMKQAVEDGIVIPETQPTASGWAYEWSKVVCAFAAYLSWRGHDRIMTIRGNAELHASAGGVADEHFLQKKGADRAGEPYDYILLGDNPQEAFKNLCLAWDNKLEGGFNDTQTTLVFE